MMFVFRLFLFAVLGALTAHVGFTFHNWQFWAFMTLSILMWLCGRLEQPRIA